MTYIVSSGALNSTHSLAATSASQYKKKTKIEQNAIDSCRVLQFHVL